MGILTVEEIQETFKKENYRKRGNRKIVDKVLGHFSNSTIFSWYFKKAPDSRFLSSVEIRSNPIIRTKNFIPPEEMEEFRKEFNKHKKAAQ